MGTASRANQSRTATQSAGRGEVGALDLGSRTFKAVIGSRRGENVETRLLAKRKLDLGGDVAENDGRISAGKLEQISQALVELRDLCRHEGAGPVLAIATRAVRAASNQAAVLDLARDAGIRLEIADGVREGRVGYLAATQGAPDRLVSNLGSRSLQLAWKDSADIEAFSLDSGYETAYADFFDGAATFGEGEVRYRAFLDDGIVRLPEATTKLVCFAANTAARFATGKPKEEVTDRDLPRHQLALCIRAIREQSAGDFESFKNGTERVRKILPGLVLLDYLMDRTGHREAFIAEVELPVGLIVEYLLENEA